MAELSVSRKNISKLFMDMQGNKFIIPDYQRPYKWDLEKCDILWEDIINFHESKNDNEEYFLGTIVSFKNQNNIEIIDGQQRITSFFLLLRAFYKKLEEMPVDLRVTGLKNQIAPCIWDVDSISQQVEDFQKIHIETLVATDNDKAKFHNVLAHGTVNTTDNDIYSNNYRFFYNKCQEYAQNNPMQWQPLCVTILQKCIVLPIECDYQDTALRIFSTLNDRGMPLSDSDIFKAQIYKNQSTDAEKRIFTNKWKELTSICKDANITLDDLFRYYTHILRAREGDKSKEVALRKFYYQGDSQYEKLKSNNLIEDLFSLASFWLYVNSSQKNEYIALTFDFEISKYLHIISKYPNEFWRYITSVYYLENKSSEDFNERFLIYLKELISVLFVRFIEKPTVNAIKDDIYQGCINIHRTNSLGLKPLIEKADLKKLIPTQQSSKLSRAILLLHTYISSSQNEIIIRDFDIEHIFPRKWQTANYNGWNEADAKIYLEKFGNKIPIEKKLNIQAGNNYFAQKKTRYGSSNIAAVKALSIHPKEDWNQEDIIAREEIILTEITNFLLSN